MPTPAHAVVLFAHGSGSSRLSPRNTYVATALNEAGLATLLFDLLTTDEALDRGGVQLGVGAVVVERLGALVQRRRGLQDRGRVVHPVVGRARLDRGAAKNL